MARNYAIDNESFTTMSPVGRGSYMQSIHEPRAFSEGDKPEWSCQMRWEKGDPIVEEWIKELKMMFMIILTKQAGTREKAVQLAKSCKIPLRDGDNEELEELHGHYFINCRNKFRQPWVLGPHAKKLPEELITPDEIYSGAHYRARIRFYWFSVTASKARA